MGERIGVSRVHRVMTVWMPLALVAVAMLVAAPSALGVGGLTLTVSAGPVRGVAVHLSAQGTAPGPDAYGNTTYTLWTRSRPASWGPCGADVINDPNRSE